MNITTIFSKIQRNYENYRKGDYNCIPFSQLSELKIPGIEQQTYYLISASSGVGKSKFTRAMFVKSAIESNKPFTLFYFSLEESKDKIVLSEISKQLWYKYGIKKSTRELLSVGKDSALTESDLENIVKVKPDVINSLSKIHIIDNVRNADEIYNMVINYKHKVGKIVGNRYIADNPDEYVIVIVDHIGLLEVPSRSTLKQEISKLSSIYAIELRNKYKCSLVFVQQQSASLESTENIKLTKVEPSYANLGEHKLTYQDCDVMISLFNPYRYGFLEYKKYKLNILENNYRAVIINKDRYGEENVYCHTIFDAVLESFKALPPPKSKMIETIYKTYGGTSQD
jgi:replicative DNA helicase